MEKRNVSLPVGNRTYNLLTSLDGARLEEVTSLLQDALSTTDSRMLQDERLFLASLHLASALVSFSHSLDELTDKLSETNGSER